MPISTPALEMESVDGSGLHDTLETCIDKLAESIEVLSQRIHEMSFGDEDEEDEDQNGDEEEDVEDEDESENEDEDESEDGDEDETEAIPVPTKSKARAMCTKHIGKHAKDLWKLAKASPRKSRKILANAPPTLHQALGDVARLVLDRKLGVPEEHLDETNEHIHDMQEFVDAPLHEKRQILQTGSGFLSTMGTVLGAVAKPILSLLGI